MDLDSIGRSKNSGELIQITLFIVDAVTVDWSILSDCELNQLGSEG